MQIIFEISNDKFTIKKYLISLKKFNKMKTFKNFNLIITGLLFFCNSIVAQIYEAPMVDVSGKFTNADGVKIGTVNEEGVTDNNGSKIAFVDNEGNLIDSRSGKNMGKAEKNGNFTYIFSEAKDIKKFTVGIPAQGTCTVKDESGNIVLFVHENFKQQSACAYHYANMNEEGKKMQLAKDHSVKIKK